MDAAQEKPGDAEEAWQKVFELDRRIAELNSRAANEMIDRRNVEYALMGKIRKLKRKIAKRDKVIVAAMMREGRWNGEAQ